MKTEENVFAIFIDAKHKIQTGSKKWKKPIPAARAALYELKQMFDEKFPSQTQFS